MLLHLRSRRFHRGIGLFADLLSLFPHVGDRVLSRSLRLLVDLVDLALIEQRQRREVVSKAVPILALQFRGTRRQVDFYRLLSLVAHNRQRHLSARSEERRVGKECRSRW